MPIVLLTVTVNKNANPRHPPSPVRYTSLSMFRCLIRSSSAIHVYNNCRTFLDILIYTLFDYINCTLHKLLSLQIIKTDTFSFQQRLVLGTSSCPQKAFYQNLKDCSTVIIQLQFINLYYALFCESSLICLLSCYQ